MNKITKSMEVFEAALMVGLMISVLWLFSLEVDSHFTLPKLAATVLFTSMLSLTILLRFYQGEINRPPIGVWVVVLSLLAWWLIGTSQSMHLQTALLGQPGRYNGLFTHVLWLVLFMLIASYPFSMLKARYFINLLYVAMLPVCGYALWQYFVGSTAFDISENAHRPISSIGNPVSLATMMVILLPFLLQDILSHAGKRWHGIYILYFLTGLLVLFLTTSRGGWIGALAALLIFAYLSRAYLLFGRLGAKIYLLGISVLVVVAITVWLFAPGQFIHHITDFSVVSSRLIYYSAALAAIASSPIFGHGFESFRIIYPQYRSMEDSARYFDITPTMVHNDFLQLAVDNGLPAMLLFIVLLLLALRLMIKGLRQQQDKSKILVPTVSALTGYLVCSLSGWYEVSTLAMFWILLGFGVAVSISSESSQVSGNLMVRRIGMVPVAAAFIFLLYFANINIDNLVLDNAYRKLQVSHAHSRGIEIDRIANLMDKNPLNNFYYQDKTGMIYMERMIKYRRHEDYAKSRDYFSRAIADNPYDAYAAMHLIQTDTIALMMQIIRRSDPKTRLEAEGLVEKDPGNPTIYDMLSRYHAALGDKTGAKYYKDKMEEVIGGEENLMKRAEALKQRAKNKRR